MGYCYKFTVKTMNNKILKELGLPSWLADDDMVEVKVIKLTKAITQARADERKKVLEEIEKSMPSHDAVQETIKKLKNL